jgi:hypothetical protein
MIDPTAPINRIGWNKKIIELKIFRTNLKRNKKKVILINTA